MQHTKKLRIHKQKMDLLEIENEKLAQYGFHARLEIAQYGFHARLEMLCLQVAMDRLL